MSPSAIAPLGRRLVVRARRVLTGGDDREVRPLVTELEHALDELAVHVELAPPDERARAHLDRDLRRPRAAAARERGDLVGVLHHADRRRRPRTRARTSRAAARAGGRARTAPTCGRRSRHASAADPTSRATSAIGSSVSSHGTISNRSGRGVDPRRLEPGHDEPGVAGARQHEHREPFERHRLVAGEVRQVGADRQQQHVDAELAHPLARTRDPRASSVTRRSRAARRCSPRSSTPSTRRARRRPWPAPSRGGGRDRRRGP